MVLLAEPEVCICLWGKTLSVTESEATGSQHGVGFVFDCVVLENEAPSYCTLLSASELGKCYTGFPRITAGLDRTRIFSTKRQNRSMQEGRDQNNNPSTCCAKQ